MTVLQITPNLPPVWGPYGEGDDQLVEYVIVSAVCDRYAHETYIFPCDSSGRVTSWSEMDGSYRGGTDHERALLGLGYEVAA